MSPKRRKEIESDQDPFVVQLTPSFLGRSLGSLKPSPFGGGGSHRPCMSWNLCGVKPKSFGDGKGVSFSFFGAI